MTAPGRLSEIIYNLALLMKKKNTGIYYEYLVYFKTFLKYTNMYVCLSLSFFHTFSCVEFEKCITSFLFYPFRLSCLLKNGEVLGIKNAVLSIFYRLAN